MKILAIFAVILFITFSAIAQSELQQELEKEEKTNGFNTSKVYYGGYLDLSFGSYTVIGIKPLVGYKFTPELSGGIQVSFDYSSSGSYSASNYGGSLFGRYRIIPQAYVHVEFSTVNYELFNFDEGSERKWVPFLFVGAGFSQPVSQRTWLNAQVLFDVLQHKNSPYSDWEPFFSIGFGVGF